MSARERARLVGRRLGRALDRASPRRAREPEDAVRKELVPPGAVEGPVPSEPAEPSEAELGGGALRLLRRGLRETPELRAGLGFTVVMALALTAGRVLVPVLVQQTLDRGLAGPGGFRPRLVYTAAAGAAVLVGLLYLVGRATYLRLVQRAEAALAALRVRAFEHIHRLSIAEQTAERRGTFVARVTADVDALVQFLDWGGIQWITASALMLGAAGAMVAYSWRLALVVLPVVVPLFLLMRRMQRGMLAAYDRVRTRVGETLAQVSESLMGAAVVRAYGLEERVNRRLREAIGRRYRAEMRAARYMATIFPMADLFGTLTVAAAVGVGAWFGPGWGLSVGRLVAFAFLVNMFVQPLSELSETFDQTQQAIAGWRKVLGVLDLPVDLPEPSSGVDLPAGALSVRVEGVTFAYRDGGGLVLGGIDLEVPAGAHVAVVGETGCGKTTFAKLLGRLADPVSGRILVGGVDLREVSPASRRRAIRMVPQDGFLWDTTVRENVRFGRAGATDEEVEATFRSLGLEAWVRSLPLGLDTPVGERGESLSVGERQLVALARAQLADPGLLILDEATSAVDPETERALSRALARLSEGRTTVTIAHRLSTAEAADEVLVFDRGRVVERGTHAELVARGGVYASLYRSWLGNVEAGEAGPGSVHPGHLDGRVRLGGSPTASNPRRTSSNVSQGR
ncbi:MAG TPA: ABC transporter ATP-binding protein [Actinomycetota bacterium]|nr:ABC transporter ATP-binding protein [Actinomycetota bacterium]